MVGVWSDVQIITTSKEDSGTSVAEESVAITWVLQVQSDQVVEREEEGGWVIVPCVGSSDVD